LGQEDNIEGTQGVSEDDSACSLEDSALGETRRGVESPWTQGDEGLFSPGPDDDLLQGNGGGGLIAGPFWLRNPKPAEPQPPCSEAAAMPSGPTPGAGGGDETATVPGSDPRVAELKGQAPEEEAEEGAEEGA